MEEAMEIRPFQRGDLAGMRTVWNEVVEGGVAFPQENLLNEEAGWEFFSAQAATTVAVRGGKVLGLSILHPNNVGRCSHVANASYAVSSKARGRGIGRALVLDSLERAGRLGFKGLQFNAVVESNAGARHLYEDLGFTHVGTVPDGFRMKDGSYANTCIYYHAI